MAVFSINRIAVYQQVMTELKLVDGFNDANVMMRVRPVFLTNPPGDQYVQVVTGTAIEKQARSYLGYCTDQITIAVFKRLLTDQAERDTQKITNDAVGLMKLMGAVESAMINTKLAGLLTATMCPVRTDAPEESGIEADGWVMMRRTFDMQHQYDFPAEQSIS